MCDITPISLEFAEQPQTVNSMAELGGRAPNKNVPFGTENDRAHILPVRRQARVDYQRSARTSQCCLAFRDSETLYFHPCTHGIKT